MKESIKRSRYCPYCAQNTICEIILKNNIHKCESCKRIFTPRETIKFKKENIAPGYDDFISDSNPTTQIHLKRWINVN